MKCREKNIGFLNEEEMSYLIKNSNLNHLNSWNMNALMILQESGTCPLGLTREMIDYLLLNTDLSIESSPRKRKFLDLLIETDNCLGFTDKQLDFIINSHNAISDDIYAVILMALKYMSGKNIFSENQIKIILDKKPYIKKDSSGIYQLTPKFLALTKSPSENIEKIMRFFDVVNTGQIISNIPYKYSPTLTAKI